MSIVEMKILRWMSGNILKDRMKNENIPDKLGYYEYKIRWERFVWDGLFMYIRGPRCSN